MKWILLVEQDETLRQHLGQTLAAAGRFRLASSASWQDACLQLGMRRFDVALLGEQQPLQQTIDSLRMIQTDLPVVALSGDDQRTVITNGNGSLQAVLPSSQLAEQADRVLTSAIRSEVSQKGGSHPKLHTGRLPVNKFMVLPVLEEAELDENIDTYIFGHESGLIAHYGLLTERQAAAISVVAQRSWSADDSPVMLQFLQVPGRRRQWLVYSRAVGSGYLLSLVAWPHTAPSMLRRQAEALALKLSEMVGVKIPLQSQARSARDSDSASVTPSFAILWRPIERLPTVLHIPLRRTLERIARENNCQLEHLQVESAFVHMVVTCPAGKTAIWATHQFKTGSEAAIREQFGVQATLWARGYFASETRRPLSQMELDLYLERSLGQRV